MRYLRDLGMDAHLVLLINDYTKTLAHFAPENDTWEFEKWHPFIHYLDYGQFEAIFFRSKRKIKKDFLGYDILIASGYIPSLFYKKDIELDIFYPYSTGIEGVGDLSRTEFKQKSFYKKWVFYYLKYLQIKGLKKTRACFNFCTADTKDTFGQIGVDFVNIPIPMVYNKGGGPTISPEKVCRITDKLAQYKHVFMCHARHDIIKIHDYYLAAFSNFIKKTNKNECIFVLFEYGQIVEVTKEKIKQLDIEDNVMWVPKMSRKEILLIMERVDLGFCDFDGNIWGGLGYEFASKGVPFFHYLNLDKEQFENEYEIPYPDFINTNSPEIIYNHLIKFTQNPEPYRKMGIQIKEWFDKYAGIGLARRWKELIEEVYQKKQLNENLKQH